MPNLRDLNLKISYGPSDKRLLEFFIPAMAASVRYDRAAGYFSSTMLAVAATGVTQLIANGGRMRLLCGADLSEDDVEAIRQGHVTLEEGVSARMKLRLVLPESDYVQRRLEALAWLVGTDQLEIKVVLPTDQHGKPLPASKSDCYYHPKEGMFTDTQGDQIGFSGSVNESATALESNYESFMVFNSWETAPHLAMIRIRFDQLWGGKERDWLAMPIPDAAKQELLKYRPSTPPLFDPLEPKPPEPDEKKEVSSLVDSVQRERILFQYLRDAPYLIGAGRLGQATSTVSPWPHQTRVADAILERFPERFMLCDEVGLGKTIEAGLVIRQLIISGVVQRALILVPKSVLVQWQEELYEKFVLNVPRFDGATFRDVFGREICVPVGTSPWDSQPIMLASSHLAKRRERQEQLLSASAWDLVVVDEAHHARRKDFLDRDQYRPNRLLELLSGTHGRRGLREKTKGLLLLTATPMQIDPVEVWDLLKLLGMGGRWGVEGNFLRYFEELKLPFEEIDWPFVLGMVNDYFDTGGEWDQQFCRVAENRVGPVVWEEIRSLHRSKNWESVIRQLDPTGQAALRQLAGRHTPIRRHIFRNTRTMLREYHRQGLLKETVPERDPRSEWVTMRPDEWSLYERIEKYIRNHYAKYEAERRGLGFIMTVYRRRLTSSFYAIQCSLKRRLDYLRGAAGAGTTGGLTDDDLDQDDLDTDVSEHLFGDGAPADEDRGVLDIFRGEIEYVENFLARLRVLGTDSKFEKLATDLADVLRKRDTVIVFTQYTDTMDYLRDKLRGVYGGQVACYSGRGGERWEGGRWAGTSKENIKSAFRDSQEIKILLCTESASEGLNLQTCGVLINYDMPWNPMRVEQRIGRIDRIGQRYKQVWVRNYFYDGTVEATIYQRLDERIASFEGVVGELQPILSRVARVIEAAAMATDEKRGELIAKEVAEINRIVRSAEISALDLDTLVDLTVAAPIEAEPPVTMSELERTLVESIAFAGRFLRHPSIACVHLFDWRGADRAVTFEPAVFDEHPNSVQLLSFGSGLLEEILTAVDAPADDDRAGVVVRCYLDHPARLVGYYGPDDVVPIPVRSLARLRDLLDSQSPEVVARSQAAPIVVKFREAAQPVLSRDVKAAQSNQSAHESSLVEEARQLLLRAAYIELAQAANRDLFDGEGGPFDFSEQAFERLKRHRFPFAGALKLVDMAAVRPRQDDPDYATIAAYKRDVLLRRFESIRSQLGDVLTRLVAARKVGALGGDDGRIVQPAVQLLSGGRKTSSDRNE